MNQNVQQLLYFKVIRDAAHGDLEFDKDEIEMINTREFQRLRHIRQLGLAYLVYPSASHSRFEHVLGVCHLAQKIIDVVNRADPGRISDDDRKIIRYLALLHDVGHVPFGHTLEDERPVLDNKHDGHDRLNFFLHNTAIGEKLEKVETELGLQKLRNTLLTVLCATKKGGDPKSKKAVPKEKLYADIVGNTICADLLDYLKRDALFTGIQHRYDDRIISNFRVTEESQLFINLTDDRSARTGLLSEILHLLRLRYTLGERVYYHRTKAAASAMVSRAVELLGLKEQDLCDLGDDELLFILENPVLLVSKFPRLKEGPVDDQQAAARIASLLRKRALYEPVFRITRGDAEDKHKKNDLVSRYHSSKNRSIRQKIETEMTEACGLKPGQVIIYCPDGDMSLKEAEVQVRHSTGVDLEKLKDVTDRNVSEDINALKEKHLALWSLEVLVDPDVLAQKGKQIASVFEGIHTNLNNDIAMYRGSGAGELAWEALVEAGKRSGLKDMSTLQELMASAHKKGTSDLTTPEKWIEAYPDKLNPDLFSSSKPDEKKTKRPE